VIVEAPAKLNLCLYLGPTREDGLHEIASLFEPLELADRLEVSEADSDRVVCEGVEGPDLTARALAALREAGWERPPLRIETRKRIPVAAGLGGGSADAAAVLRMALGEVEGLPEIAAGLGADVPSQLDPRPCLVTGAGERVHQVEPGPPLAVLLVPPAEGLSTADVYGEADRLGLQRDPEELARIGDELREAAAGGLRPLDRRDLLVNDLQPAALSLRPELGSVIEELQQAGAAHAAVTGSGPTVFGLFSDPDPIPDLSDQFPSAIATRSLR
jgi:4-diphosphocytidyl-2-C-methyl-D-erythritol kinase